MQRIREHKKREGLVRFDKPGNGFTELILKLDLGREWVNGSVLTGWLRKE